jgi:hypothetical protein
LLIGDGTAIAPTTAQTFARVEVPSNSQAQRLITSTRRKLIDLPALPKQLNSYAVLLVYTASGLSDQEISAAIGLSIPQISSLRQAQAYTQLEQYVLEAAREQSKEHVIEILAAGESKAAEKLTALLDSEDEKIVLAASKDVLDRRGHTPKQQVDVNVEMRKTFRIEYVDRRNDPEIIDMEVENGDNK